MAIPLFIFAATVCRFVGDRMWDAEEQLQNILINRIANQATKLDQTYQPVLDRLLTNQTESQKRILADEFRTVVGTIVLLASPLSPIALARLLGISGKTVKCRLDPLHSVLSVPTNQYSPVRLLHLSFREFLVDPQKQGRNPFWADEEMTHRMVAIQCLKLMSDSLREDICNLKSPGILKSEVIRQIIDDNLSAEVRYACCNWVHHLQYGENQILDHDIIYDFLSKHLLHWLEALSLIERLHESIEMIRTLTTLIDVSSIAVIFYRLTNPETSQITILKWLISFSIYEDLY